MADSSTPHRGYTLPEVGASPGTWGNKLNADLVQIDAEIHKLITTGKYALAGGTVDVVTASLDPSWSSYQAGNWLLLKMLGANTTGVTVNVDGLGAKAIKLQDGSALPAGFTSAGRFLLLAYDGADFRVLNAPSLSELRGVLGADTTAGATGSVTHPGGVIEKWGVYSGGASTAVITFAAAFPTACDNVQLTGIGTGNSPTGLGASPVTGDVPIVNVKAGSVTAAGFQVYVTGDEYDVSWAHSDLGFYWRAIGR